MGVGVGSAGADGVGDGGWRMRQLEVNSKPGAGHLATGESNRAKTHLIDI